MLSLLKQAADGEPIIYERISRYPLIITCNGSSETWIGEIDGEVRVISDWRRCVQQHGRFSKDIPIQEYFWEEYYENHEA